MVIREDARATEVVKSGRKGRSVRSGLFVVPRGCTARGPYWTTTFPVILGWIEQK